MSKTPKTKPANQSAVMAALHPEPKSSAAGHPGAKAGAKTGSRGAAGRKG